MYPNVRNAPGGRMNTRMLVVSGNRVIPNTLPAPRISRALPRMVRPSVKPKPQPIPSNRLATGDTFGAGTTGEVCAVALLLGLAYMLWKKIITWHIPVSIIATVFVFSGLMHLANPVYANPFAVIFSGGLMLGAIFMATDYVTSPMTHKGMLIYGVCIGLLTIIIRNWGSYPEGMSFAILIMNAFTPLINTYVKPKRFGEKPAKK